MVENAEKLGIQWLSPGIQQVSWTYLFKRCIIGKYFVVLSGNSS
jgi:hypothetical protein